MTAYPLLSLNAISIARVDPDSFQNRLHPGSFQNCLDPPLLWVMHSDFNKSEDNDPVAHISLSF